MNEGYLSTQQSLEIPTTNTCTINRVMVFELLADISLVLSFSFKSCKDFYFLPLRFFPKHCYVNVFSDILTTFPVKFHMYNWLCVFPTFDSLWTSPDICITRHHWLSFMKLFANACHWRPSYILGLFGIWGSHSGDNEELYLLRYNTTQSGESQPALRGNLPRLSSGSNSKASRSPTWRRQQAERTGPV
jgi:hypothetical protein